MTGLALALGFNSRSEILNFNGKKIYLNIISRALSYIEDFAEAKLFDKGGYSGAKFFLSNNFKNWSEKSAGSNEDSLAKLDKILSELSKKMKTN